MLGGEPILSPDGEPLVDAQGPALLRDQRGSGPSVGKHLLLAYLPAEQASAGTRARRRVSRRAYPVTVAVAGSTPLFDPDNARIRS